MSDVVAEAEPSVLILACGALAQELRDVVAANRLSNVTVAHLPGELHNRPDAIAPAVDARLDELADGFDRVLLGYGDCGSGGRLDALCERRGIERLPGSHCYEFFAGREQFAELHEREPGTFYLTDYLAKHFDLMVWNLLGLDRHPGLYELYFGNYRRLVHLAQVDNPAIRAKAEAAADRLQLEFEWRFSGYGELEPAVVSIGRSA